MTPGCHSAWHERDRPRTTNRTTASQGGMRRIAVDVAIVGYITRKVISHTATDDTVNSSVGGGPGIARSDCNGWFFRGNDLPGENLLDLAGRDC